MINKTDNIANQQELLAFVSAMQQKHTFAEIIPISAKTGFNTTELEKLIAPRLPENPFFYDPEQITDRSERFLLAEMIREKIFRLTGEELPYSATVEIEQCELKNNIYHVSALILVERSGQKRIIIGSKGTKLKEVGKKSRQDMEKLLGKKVFLQLWVKVKSGWSDDERLLKSLGYTD